jgi:hypothetical protein
MQTGGLFSALTTEANMQKNPPKPVDPRLAIVNALMEAAGRNTRTETARDAIQPDTSFRIKPRRDGLSATWKRTW